MPDGARFCPSCGASQNAPAQEGQRRQTPLAGADELRPITALFADVVGSTSLGERLSPDEVKSLIGECVSRMTHAVEEYGGTIQAYMGDGIAAYFGLPAAHEDDAERAALAALRIQEVVREYARDIAEAWGITDFNVRVGINSGQVGVGLVGGANPQAVGLGDATNVAARLQSATEPGTTAVGDATARLLAHQFLLESLGEVTVKGREEPVQWWRLVGSRTEQEVSRTPLVGRERELERLRAMIGELGSGRGQILEVLGDVGIGKTRLLTELRDIAGDRLTWLEGRCMSYGSELLYAPFVEMLREWLGVSGGEAEVAVRTRLRARLNQCLGSRLPEVLPFLGRLLSVKLEPDAEAQLAEVRAEDMARRIRAAYRTWVESLTEQRPLVVAVEDLHWADPSTRELAEDLLEVTDRAPLLLATTFRKDMQSEGWKFRVRVLADYAHRAEELELGPLSAEDAEKMADALIPGGQLDQWTRKAIVDRAEGNPLYLEELFRGLIESGVLERRRTWTLSVSKDDLLPPALESLLVARIDRLPPGPRRLAQVASVVGRMFPVRLLERLADSPDLDGDLAVLLRADIIRELRRYPEVEYTFRHGLLQEAALSTLPPATQRELSGTVASVAEELYAATIDDHLELLAHYWTQSRDLPKAFDYLERAGAKAAARGATEQAQEMWRRARKIARRLGDAAAEERLAARLSEAGAAAG